MNEFNFVKWDDKRRPLGYINYLEYKVIDWLNSSIYQ